MFRETPRDSIPLASGRLPVIGHLPKIHFDALGLLRDAAERLGHVFRLDYGFGIQPTMLYGDQAFSLLRNEWVRSSPIYDLAPLVVADSLVIEDGPRHRRMRRSVDGPFAPRGLDSANAGALISEIIDARLASWSHGHSVMISKDTREITLAIIFRLIGIHSVDIPVWRKKFQEFSLGTINLPMDFPGSPAHRSKRAIVWLNERLSRLITSVRSGTEPHTLLSAMVHGLDGNQHRLLEHEILGNLRLLGFAGHETTASVLSWVMLRLSADRSLWHRLRDEILDSGDGVPPSVDFADLSRFPLTEAVFRETARMYPPTWFLPRLTHEGFTYDGREITEGTLVGIPLLTLSRSTERYEDPDDFRPDRWLLPGRSRHPIETCQFGGGPHFCLGYRLALLEGVNFIVAVVRALAPMGRRPVLRGPLPKPRYLPFNHAPMRTRISFESA